MKFLAVLPVISGRVVQEQEDVDIAQHILARCDSMIRPKDIRRRASAKGKAAEHQVRQPNSEELSDRRPQTGIYRKGPPPIVRRAPEADKATNSRRLFNKREMKSIDTIPRGGCRRKICRLEGWD